MGGAEARFSKPRQVQLYLSTAHQSAVADEKMKWFQYVSVINSVASVTNARSSIWWFISFEPIPKLGYSIPSLMPIWIGIMIHQWMVYGFFFMGFPNISRQNPSADDSLRLTSPDAQKETKDSVLTWRSGPGGDWWRWGPWSSSLGFLIYIYINTYTYTHTYIYIYD